MKNQNLKKQKAVVVQKKRVRRINLAVTMKVASAVLVALNFLICLKSSSLSAVASNFLQYVTKNVTYWLIFVEKKVQYVTINVTYWNYYGNT